MPKPQSWFNVQAAEGNPLVGEVAVRGDIGEWGLTDREFIASVEALGNVDTINVRINSRGGEMDHALSIFNYLKSHAARIHVRVDGVAMSSGSIIAMAGDEIVMPANALMMVHNPWTFAMGNAAELRKEADTLDAFEASLHATYMARTGLSLEEVKALLDETTFMTAQEAVDLGFADRVEAIGKRESASAAVAFAAALGIPDDVLAKVEAAEQAADAVEDDAADVAAADATGQSNNKAATPGDDTHTAQAATLAATIQAAAESLGMQAYAADIALDAAIVDSASAMAALRDAKEIADLCVLAKRPDLAADFIRRRASLAETRTALINARAQADEATHTDSHLPTTGDSNAHAKPGAPDNISTASIWAARRAAQRAATLRH